MIASSFVKAWGIRTGENTPAPFLAVSLSLFPNEELISVLKGQCTHSGEDNVSVFVPHARGGKGMERSPGVMERTGQGGVELPERERTTHTPPLFPKTDTEDQRVSRWPMPPCSADGQARREQATTTMTCVWPISQQNSSTHSRAHFFFSFITRAHSFIHSSVLFSFSPAFDQEHPCHTPPHSASSRDRRRSNPQGHLHIHARPTLRVWHVPGYDNGHRTTHNVPSAMELTHVLAGETANTQIHSVHAETDLWEMQYKNNPTLSISSPLGKHPVTLTLCLGSCDPHEPSAWSSQVTLDPSPHPAT